jgi:hypothetical protein
MVADADLELCVQLASFPALQARCTYNPSCAAAFSRKSEPTRMYRLTMFKLLCPVWAMMLLSDAPAIAAEVANPDKLTAFATSRTTDFE